MRPGANPFGNGSALGASSVRYDEEARHNRHSRETRMKSHFPTGLPQAKGYARFHIVSPPASDGNSLMSPVPLCVDLDGTLIFGDLALQSMLAMLRRNPLCVFVVILWWL